MRRMFNFFYTFLLALFGMGATLMAEDITLTTYYPAPYGAYNEFSTTGNTFLGTDAAGNVGIGTTTATRKLTVVGGAIRPAVGNSNQAGIYFPTDPGGGGGDEAFIRYYVEAGENTKFIIGTGNDADDDISFYQAGAERMNIYNGNVGIGITTPSHKLDVVGDINITGDVLQSGVLYRTPPDYVFEPGYNLMSITELKNYVFENRHLPNMPSAKDIKKEGVKLFEQNRLLLEKLEEAYLHIFQLEERISKLERR